MDEECGSNLDSVCGFDLDNTFHTCQSALDTKVGQTLLLTQGQIQVEVGGQGGYVVWQ